MQEFIEGKTILVDKPYGWTSFDVVNKIRWNLKKKLNVKKIKVGHAGTLDPLATGLLIVCTGKHTKLIESIMPGLKTYTGTFLIGKTTPSYDLETEFDRDFPTEHIKEDLLESAREKLTGKINQTPPVFSAKQIDGKRAYDFARAGKEVKLNSVEVQIHEFIIDAKSFPEVHFKITCSKGTYIRSIAHDFGKLVNSGATLIALRRTNSGDFSIENASLPDEIISQIMSGE
ncbi:MAG: tRNA pseudouridine(55) synthase TruB [Bacteroidota bacterium]